MNFYHLDKTQKMESIKTWFFTIIFQQKRKALTESIIPYKKHNDKQGT